MHCLCPLPETHVSPPPRSAPHSPSFPHTASSAPHASELCKSKQPSSAFVLPFRFQPSAILTNGRHLTAALTAHHSGPHQRSLSLRFPPIKIGGGGGADNITRPTRGGRQPTKHTEEVPRLAPKPAKEPFALRPGVTPAPGPSLAPSQRPPSPPPLSAASLRPNSIPFSPRPPHNGTPRVPNGEAPSHPPPNGRPPAS